MYEKIILTGKRPFQFTIISAILFVLLTIVAMLFYAGGTHSNPLADGYSFFRNFFSSLGLTIAPNGEINTVSAILFFIALGLAGFSLVVYFIFEPQFFWTSSLLKVLSILGSLFGIFAGICFIGVAFTPADLFLDAHSWFVINAFRSFLVAVVPYTIAILIRRDYPNRYAVIYAVFALVLFAYIMLMINGPRADTSSGELIQATGQKLIVYAAIISMLIQGYGSIGMIEGRKETVHE